MNSSCTVARKAPSFHCAACEHASLHEEGEAAGWGEVRFCCSGAYQSSDAAHLRGQANCMTFIRGAFHLRAGWEYFSMCLSKFPLLIESS